MSGRDPRIRNQEIEQAQLRGFARSFSEIEWLLLILVTLYLFVTRPDAAREPIVVGLLVLFAGFIVLFRFSKLLADRTAAKIGVEILGMVAFLTAVLVVLGSERAALTNLYLLPIITAAGFDPVWFGVIVTINMEIGLITPPVGLNLFVVNAIAPDVPTKTVLWGSVPYVMMMILAIIILSIFPDIATWLPDYLMGAAVGPK